MGNNCSSYSGKDQYQFQYQFLSPTFGTIKLMRNEKLGKDVALKFLSFCSQMDLKQYMRLVNNAESYHKIPTLLKIISCSVDQKPSCHSFGCYLYFQYIKNSLGALLNEKKTLLSEFLVMNRDDKEYKSLNYLKLYDYQKIDKTSPLERKYVNIHFLEAEILRMIDHVLGAAFFLYHLNNQQNSIRPNNILLDDEGKYILVDRELFRLKTNYELSLHSSKNVPYLSPQQMKSLKTQALHSQASSQLSDIFSIGLIALEMCTLDSLIGLYDYEQMRFNSLQLNRLLSNARQHYSDQLVGLIEKMLSIQESSRIDFSTLIDSLSPILSKNVDSYNKVYGGTWTKDSEQMSNRASQGRFNDIHRRLSQIQDSYHKVMSSKIIEKPYNLKQQHLNREEENVLRRLKQAQKHKNNTKSQRQVKSNDLYQMYLKQYNSISQSRGKCKN